MLTTVITNAIMFPHSSSVSNLFLMCHLNPRELDLGGRREMDGDRAKVVALIKTSSPTLCASPLQFNVHISNQRSHHKHQTRKTSKTLKTPVSNNQPMILTYVSLRNLDNKLSYHQFTETFSWLRVSVASTWFSLWEKHVLWVLRHVFHYGETNWIPLEAADSASNWNLEVITGCKYIRDVSWLFRGCRSRSVDAWKEKLTWIIRT